MKLPRIRSGQRRAAQRCAAPRRQSGLTIIELMVALAVGLLVVMAATALLLSSKSGYTVQDESTRLQETGRFALEAVARAVRQTAYREIGGERALTSESKNAANIRGIDSASVSSTSPGIDSPSSGGINGSDVLALQFFGSSDGTILNCAGMSVPAPDAREVYADAKRGWSIFYVAKAEDGEPELRCKYRGSGPSFDVWKADAIARGVESFQVLYGVDTDKDGLPNQFVSATEVDKLDGSLTLAGANPEAKAADLNAKTYWKKVVAVKIGLLLRTAAGVPNDGTLTRFYPLGAAYGDAQGALDAGTKIELASLSDGERKRARKVFAMTIQLRNLSSGWPE